MIGISVKNCTGIGDKIQFTSVPENYFVQTGEKLVDVDESWVFDYNPYVVRGVTADKVIDPWRAAFAPPPNDGRTIYTSLAERNCAFFGIKARVLKHPRLYRFEDIQAKSNRVSVHPFGVSQPSMTKDITDHIELVYPESYQIGSMNDPLWLKNDYRTDDIWKSVEMIASSKLFIGCDSGPSWIAACYPKVWTKKVIMQLNLHEWMEYIPMRVLDPHSHWYDPCFTFYNRFIQDAGISYSYKKL